MYEYSTSAFCVAGAYKLSYILEISHHEATTVRVRVWAEPLFTSFLNIYIHTCTRTHICTDVWSFSIIRKTFYDSKPQKKNVADFGDVIVEIVYICLKTKRLPFNKTRIQKKRRDRSPHFVLYCAAQRKRKHSKKRLNFPYARQNL